MSALGLTALFLLIFGIAGVQIFKNVYHYQCLAPDGGLEPAFYGDEYGCGHDEPARSCPANYRCNVRHRMHCCLLFSVVWAFALTTAGCSGGAC